MRIAPLVGGRRIAHTTFLTVLVALGAVSTAHATYSSTVLGDSPSVLYKLDEGIGATTAVNAGSLGASADGTYRNFVRNGRSAAVVCERRQSWLDTGLLTPSHVSSDCKTRGDLAGRSAFFSGGPYNPQVQASMVPESLSYTLEAWVKPEALVSDGGIIDHGDNGVLAINDGVLTFIAHATDGNAIAVDDGPLAPVGDWFHVAATWNNATGTATIYINGTVQGSDTANPLDPGAANGSPSLYVGWTNQDGLGGFVGNIDNAAVYPTALSQATLAGHYAQGTFIGTKPRVTALTPEPGSVFNSTSTKGAQTILDFGCANSTSCTATVDGNPINDGDPLPLGGGSHTIEITAADGFDTMSATSTYSVSNFKNVVTNDGPVAYWRLNESTSALVAADEGGLYPGNYQNPSANGGTGISGDLNAARSFLSGDGGYVGVANVPSNPEGYTIEMWFKTAAGDLDDMALFDHGATGGGPALYLVGNTIRYRMVDGQVLSAPFTRGAWTHVAATWDGVRARLYTDGVMSGSAIASAQSPSGTPALYLGFANVGLSQPAFRGLMDEVSYFGSALSDNRVFNHYLADPPPPGASSSDASGAPSSFTADSSVATPAAAPDKVAAAKHARAKAKARAKARANAKALAKARAHARAKAKAKAKRAKARGKRRGH